MASTFTAKYAVLTTSKDATLSTGLLDLGLNYGAVTTVGQNIQYVGSALVDAVFLRPGVSIDFTASGAGIDKLYVGGNLADYTLKVVGTNVSLSRTVNGQLESATVAVGDTVVFANGSVGTQALFDYVSKKSQAPVLGSETSVNPSVPIGDGVSPTVSMTGLNKTGVTFASGLAGAALVVKGTAGVDNVYVKAGTQLDASGLGAGVDNIYFTGKYADYTKEVVKGNLVFKRTVNGTAETVTLAGKGDRAVFADGSVLTDSIAKAPTAPTPAGWDASTQTPTVASDVSAITLDVANSSKDTKGKAKTLYKQGDELVFNVKFAKDVDVDAAGGKPQLAFLMGNKTVYATYDGALTGSSKTDIKFKYKVQADDLDDNGISVLPSTASSSAISLNGGAIKLTGTSTPAAIMQTPAMADVATAKVDGVAPVITASYQVDENTLADKVLKNVSLAAGEAVTWLGLSGPDAAAFTLGSGKLAGKLLFKGATNYEMQSSYNVTLTGVDAAGNQTTQNITISLKDINEAPVVQTALVNQVFAVGKGNSYSVPSGAFLDEDQGSQLSYTAKMLVGKTLSDLPNWLTFNTNTQTFEVTADASKGFTAKTAPITVRVTATDTAIATATATATGAKSVTSDFKISWSTAPVVKSLTVSDADSAGSAAALFAKSGDPLTLTLKLSEAVTSTQGLTAVFTVGGKLVSAKAAKVSSATDTLVFSGLTVPDGAYGNISLKSLVADAKGVIQNDAKVNLAAPMAGAVVDADYWVDSLAPSFTAPTAQVSVAENTASTSVVYKAVAKDSEGAVSYALTAAGAGASADNDKFTIDAQTGELRFKASPDFERPSSSALSNTYSVQILAKDNAGNSALQTVSVNVTDVNEAPTAIALSANTITENVTVDKGGVLIGQLSATDTDASGNNNVLSLSGTGNDNSNFEIRTASNGVSSLYYIGASPDYETKSSYKVSVTSTDGSLVKTQDFTINVTDVREAVPSAPVVTGDDGADMTYRYVWVGRVSNGGSWFRLSEVEVLSGGVNVAKATGASATAFANSGQASKAQDGDSTNEWSSGGAGAANTLQWWQLDLGKAMRLDQIKFKGSTLYPGTDSNNLTIVASKDSLSSYTSLAAVKAAGAVLVADTGAGVGDFKTFQPATTTTDTTPTLSGTLDVAPSDGQALRIYDTSTAEPTYLGTANVTTANGQTTWSLAVPNSKALSAGQHTMVAKLMSSDADNATVLTQGQATAVYIKSLATFSGTFTGEVTEAAPTATVSGTLSVTDLDPGEAGFQAVAPAALTGTYGSFSFNKDTGAWSYTLDNTKAATQALSSTDQPTETLTVKSIDGTTQTITVTVRGSAQAVSSAPVVTGDDGADMAYRYVWVGRVSNGGSWFRLSEVEVLSGGVNVAKATGASATAFANSGQASRAQDGDSTNEWSSGGAGAANTLQWWQLDLGQAMRLDQIKFKGSTLYPGTDSNNLTIVASKDSLSSYTSLAAVKAAGAVLVADTGAGVGDFKTFQPATTTTDTTPTLSGTLDVAPSDGQALRIYDTSTAEPTYLGTANVTTANGQTTWSLAVPNSKALSAGQHTVVAKLMSSDADNATVLTQGQATAVYIKSLATFSGTFTGEVTEAAPTATVSGTLSVTDLDPGEAGFQAVAPAALTGTYGSFSFNKDTGAWSYTLDNTKAATQALSSTDQPTETLTVKSIDGTTQTITVTVRGSAQAVSSAPVVTGDDGADMTYRYVWVGRVSNGWNHLRLSEVEVLSGGVNVAKANGASTTAFANSGQANRAQDGDSTNEWSSGGAGADKTLQWWQLDLGQAMRLDQIRLKGSTTPLYPEVSSNNLTIVASKDSLSSYTTLAAVKAAGAVIVADTGAGVGDFKTFLTAATTTDTTPTLSGTLDVAPSDGQALRIYDTSTAEPTYLGTANVTTANGQTTWSLAVPNDKALGLGRHTVVAKLMSSDADNATVLTQSQGAGVNIVAPLPVASITQLSDDNATHGSATGPFTTVTDDTTPTVSGSVAGTLAEGQAIHIFDGDQFIGVATPGTASGGATPWSFTPTTPLGAGTHSLTAKVLGGGLYGVASGAARFAVQTLDRASITTDDGSTVVQPDLSVSGVLSASKTVLGQGDLSLLTTANISGKGAGSWITGNGYGNRRYSVGPLTLEADGTYTAWLSYSDGSSISYQVNVQFGRDPDGNVWAQAIAQKFINVLGTNSQVAVTDLTVKGISPYTITDTTPVLTGTLATALDDGQTVQVYDTSSGTAVWLGQAQVSAGATTWRLAVPSGKALSAGQHTIVAKVEDANQTVISSSVGASLKVQELKVTQAADDVSTHGSSTGALQSGASTDDTTPTLSGTFNGQLASGQTIDIYDTVNGSTTKLGSATTVANGNGSGLTWSFTPDTALSAGAHHFSAKIGTNVLSTNALDLHLSSAPAAMTASTTAGTPQKDGQAQYVYLRRDLNSPAEWGMAEVQVLDAQGHNLALGKPVTEGGQGHPYSDAGPEKITDGTDGTDAVGNRYTSNATADGWLQIDLGRVQSVAQVVVRTAQTWANASATSVWLSKTSLANKTLSELQASGSGAVQAGDGIGILTGDQTITLNVPPPSVADSTPHLSGSLTQPLALGDVLQVVEQVTTNGQTSIHVLGQATVSTTGGQTTWALDVDSAKALSLGLHTVGTRIVTPGVNGGADTVVAASAWQSMSITAPDTTAPVFQSAATSVGGTKVILTYDDVLNANTADASAFTVLVDGQARSVSSVAVNGRTLELTLASAITEGQSVSVAYTVPTADHISFTNAAVQDREGNDALSLSTTSVTNNVGTLSLSQAADDVSTHGSSTGTLQSGASTDDTTPTLSGTYSGTLLSGDTIDIYDTVNGSATKLGSATTVANANGSGLSWSFTPDTALSAGAHHFSARIGTDLVSTNALDLHLSSAPAAMAFSTTAGQAAQAVQAGRYVYLRLDRAASSGDGYWSMNEVQVLDAQGNNLALNKTVTMGAQGYYIPNNNTASLLTDGNANSIYASAMAVNDGWLQIDLGSVQNIKQVLVMPTGGAAARMVGTSVWLSNSSLANKTLSELQASGSGVVQVGSTVASTPAGEVTLNVPPLVADSTPHFSGSLTQPLALGDVLQVVEQVTTNGQTSIHVLGQATVSTTGGQTTWALDVDTDHTLSNGVHTIGTRIVTPGVNGGADTVVAASAWQQLRIDTVPVFPDGDNKTVTVVENVATTTVVYDAEATDNGGAADAGITYSLTGTDANSFDISAAGVVTLKASADYETQASYAINVVATDAVGNASTQAVTVEVLDDIDPPTAMLKAEALANNGNAVVQSSETGMAYLVKNTHTVSSLADITGADDSLWNSVAIGTANTDTNLSVAGLLAGVYKLYTADAEGNLSAVSSDTVLVSNTSTTALSLNAGSADTDFGNLIAPVYVDKSWYLAWDLNGDGVHNDTRDSTGKFDSSGSVVNANGTGYQRDFMTHDVLDGIFKFDSAGNLESDSNAVGSVGYTDNTFRFATLNGVKLALPTLGDGQTTLSSFGNVAGTAVDNSPTGETNPTYDDLLAIWDGHNGTGTGTDVDGLPPEWENSGFWSATPSMDGYTEVNFVHGSVSNKLFDASYAVVQVL